MSSEFFLSLSRDEARAVTNQRLRRWAAEARGLARDLSMARGTSYEHELRSLLLDIRQQLVDRGHGRAAKMVDDLCGGILSGGDDE